MDPFEALAEPARRRLIDILASGEHTSGELAAVVGHEYRISRTAVSKHLRILRDADYVNVRADQRWRWYRLSRDGFEALELAVATLRLKFDSAIGWDADAQREYDPLAATAWGFAVPFKGPGRPPRRGRRGKQTTRFVAGEPDHGLYPISLPPDLDEAEPS